jgi:hypothetical protein
MKLDFNPLACSLASNIVVYEAGLPTEFVEVDQAKRASEGTGFWTVNPRAMRARSGSAAATASRAA